MQCSWKTPSNASWHPSGCGTVPHFSLEGAADSLVEQMLWAVSSQRLTAKPWGQAQKLNVREKQKMWLVWWKRVWVENNILLSWRVMVGTWGWFGVLPVPIGKALFNLFTSRNKPWLPNFISSFQLLVSAWHSSDQYHQIGFLLDWELCWKSSTQGSYEVDDGCIPKWVLLEWLAE